MATMRSVNDKTNIAEIIEFLPSASVSLELAQLRGELAALESQEELLLELVERLRGSIRNKRHEALELARNIAGDGFEDAKRKYVRALNGQ
jgi:hypothetical protein